MSKQISHKEFFEAEISMGITPDNPDYLRLHYNFGQFIIDRFKPKRTLEIGAGVGTLLEYLLKKNVEAVGIDLNPYEKEFFDNRNPSFANSYQIMNITVVDKYINFPIDVLISIEVFEHITDKELLSIIPYLSKVCNYFVFSSTPERTDWDLQWGHINVKDTPEWIQFFSPWFEIIEHLKAPTQWTLLFKSKFF
jgi:2-polyprenyl-3-methyl-5-hydroxy-6-metoxy-1,4-benzoquinol methylase